MKTGGFRLAPARQPLWPRVALLAGALAATAAAAGTLRGSLVGFIAINALADAALLALVNLYAPQCLKLGPLRGRLRTATLVAALAVGAAASLAVNVFNAVGPQASAGRYQFDIAPAAVHGAAGQAILFAAICVVAPLAENAFFFGLPVLLERRRGGWRWLRHVLVAAGLALFVLAHGPGSWVAAALYLIPGAVVLAAFLRWGYATSVVLHGAFNAAGFYLLPLLFR